ncbi:MAG: YesL family protein [Propionibacteriaceae bacterium]|jgi:uncharacterized membrane protein YesL|nr:YesL family protein [Propionibacteriaceae bacterium]
MNKLPSRATSVKTAKTTGVAVSEPLDLTERLFQWGTEAGYMAVPGLLWLVACLPIVTIGAATAGLFAVQVGHVVRGERELVKPFFVSFKRDFVRATLSWLVLLVVSVVLAFNSYYYLVFRPATAVFRVLGVVQVLLLGLLVCLVGCTYAVALSEGLHPLATLRFAGRTLLALKLWLLPMLLVVFAVPGLLIWLRLWPFLPFVGGAVAYLQVRILLRARVLLTVR